MTTDPGDLVGVIELVIDGVWLGEGVDVIDGVFEGVAEKPPGGALHVNTPDTLGTKPGKHSHLAPPASNPSGIKVEFAEEQIQDPFSKVGKLPTGQDLQVGELSLSW